jgi:hypothetical protein
MMHGPAAIEPIDQVVYSVEVLLNQAPKDMRAEPSMMI